jgi:hypothetical protein
MVKTCPTAGERSPPRQFSYVSFRGSGRLAFQHLRYHLLLSGNAIPVGPRPSHRCYPVRRRSICHRLAAQSRSLSLYRFPCRSFLSSGFNRYCDHPSGRRVYSWVACFFRTTLPWITCSFWDGVGVVCTGEGVGVDSCGVGVGIASGISGVGVADSMTGRGDVVLLAAISKQPRSRRTRPQGELR